MPRPSASSRDTLAAAGWECGRVGSYRALIPPQNARFSWLRPRVLWQSRNDRLARWLGDTTNQVRAGWVERMRPSVPGDLTIDRNDLDSLSLLVVGDPGEGDDSQYATVPGLLACGEGTDLMVVCSDVIYPAGEARHYEDRFYRPYKDYPKPLYALPGNHDWYDGLTGFMLNFCGAESPPDQATRLAGSSPLRGLLHRALWRRPARSDPAALARGRSLRSAPGQQPRPEHRQPGPYWALDSGL